MQLQVPKTTMCCVAVSFDCVVTFKCAVMDTFIKHLSLDILHPAVLQRNTNMHQMSQNDPGASWWRPQTESSEEGVWD